MTRPWYLLLPLAAALLVLGGCSEEDENSPPEAIIVFPEDGHHYTTEPGLVEAAVRDDGEVPLVEVRLDDVVVSSLADTLTTRLPLGRYADGLPHEITVRAYDAEGLTGDAGPITVTIDPALQTVPQIVEVAPAADASLLEVSWLPFPGATGYAWEAAPTAEFSTLLDSGETADAMATVARGDADLVYLRVRAELSGASTGWSRTRRYDAVAGWRRSYELAGSQMATAIIPAADGSLRLLSHGVVEARVARAEVELLAVAADGELQAVYPLLDASHEPTTHLVTDDGQLLLGGVRDDGAGFLAAFSLDGDERWRREITDWEPTALLREHDGALRVVGADLRDGARGGVIMTLDPADGGAAEHARFDLEAGRRVRVAWARPDTGWVVAGTPGLYDGVFARGLDAAGEREWNLRLGTADRWLLRGHGTDGQGRYLLTGIAFRETPSSRYGYVASIDDRGRLRWLYGATSWHLFGAVRPTGDGQWTAVGARRRFVTDETWLYDTALMGLSDAGARLWDVQHRLGEESQGWGLAPHPQGGWYATGFTTPDRTRYEVDLLRVDDRGQLDDSR
jgi:hypothetical protein